MSGFIARTNYPMGEANAVDWDQNINCKLENIILEAILRRLRWKSKMSSHSKLSNLRDRQQKKREKKSPNIRISKRILWDRQRWSKTTWVKASDRYNETEMQKEKERYKRKKERMRWKLRGGKNEKMTW